MDSFSRLKLNADLNVRINGIVTRAVDAGHAQDDCEKHVAKVFTCVSVFILIQA